ncbi:penicillin-binding protein 2 [Bacillota bacterium LX-D]|nr:penicillin-binding protein 2 [Bacillota bacterium LX-D]
MEEQRKKLKKTMNFFLATLILIFAGLGIRLIFLQVFRAEVYQTKSQQNQMRLLEIEARRGEILDRKNQVLATSKPVFTISLAHLDKPQEQEQSIRKLAELLNRPDLTADVIGEMVKSHPQKYEPVEIVKIPWGRESVELISRIEENRSQLPGVSILEQPQRYYPNGSLAGHLLGFIGKINEQELSRYGKDMYGLNDKIGKFGLEKAFELIYKDGKEVGLRGRKGAEQVEVNARGQVVQEMPLVIQPVPGNTIKLTIDGKLQKTLEKSMDDVISQLKTAYPKAGAGAAVVINVKTGEILALASKPDMNPNDFVDGTYAKKLDYYNNKNLLPMYNRAVQAAYPPGSTFKMITGMAGLASGKVKVTDSVVCSGAYWKPPYIKCWGVHGTVNFYHAFAVSCNTFFQYAGDKATIQYIDQVAKEFGLGSKTKTSGILGESAGVLPSPERKAELNEKWVKEQYEDNLQTLEAKYKVLLAKADEKEQDKLLQQKKDDLKVIKDEYRTNYDFYVKWRPYETYNTSIGQGDNNYTMLQMANYIATLANGGKRYRPYLLEEVIAPDGRVIEKFGPKLEHKVSLDPQILKEVRRGMLAVTQPGGTAWSLFNNFPADIQVAAKTGTAQTGRKGDDKNSEFHGVFVAFAPYDDPEIAYAGIIEYGRHGGTSAGLVAKAVFEEYFGITPKSQDIKTRVLQSPLLEE